MAATDRRPPRRLGGLVAVGLGALAGSAARAQASLDFRFLYYGESDDRTQVLDPEIFYSHGFGEKGQLGLLLAYDSISGASPTGEVPTLDATTSASSSGTIPKAEYQDTRKAIGASYARRFGAHLPSVELSYSRESDYLSRGASLTDAWDLFGGRSTLHAGVGYLWDDINPVNMTERFTKDSLSYSAGWTQVIGPRDLLDLSFSVTNLNGYLTDPYKLVTVGTVSVPENRPSTRSRQTAVVKYGHYYLSRSAVKMFYRYYTDDWDLTAHTAELQWDKRVGKAGIVSPRLRYYQQGSASFFAYEFAAPQEFMSSDYRLSSFWSWLAGLGFRIPVSERVSLTMEATYQDQTGLDRIMPRPAPVILPVAGAGGIRLEEDEEEGEGGPVSASAADLTTVTATLGFSIRF